MIEVEIIGPEPSCARCKKTMENACKAVAKLEDEGLDVKVSKINVMERETIAKYGVLRTPAIAVDGVVRMMGKVPDPGVIERIIRKEA